MGKRDFLTLANWSVEEIEGLLTLAAAVKKHPGEYRQRLAGKALALIFQKPSTRTRVSFHVGMYQLGGEALVLGQSDVQLGRGETMADTARVLSRYVDGIMARVFAQADLDTLAKHASVPVINGLSDELHPCQALSDYQTMRERFGNLKGLSVVYLGDGNNMAHSLANGAAKLGVRFTISSPEGYRPDPKIIAAAQEQAKKTGAEIRLEADPVRALKGAKVIYTDVWTSMGQEAEHAERLRDLKDYQVNAALFSKADSDAIFMHCLPAHYGEECTEEVAYHERSVVFDQAENRLHAQKAILLQLLG